MRNAHPRAGKVNSVRVFLAYAYLSLVANPTRTNTTLAEKVAGQKYVKSIYTIYTLLIHIVL